MTVCGCFCVQVTGVKVLMSLGGGAGNILPDPVPSGFAATMLAGLQQLQTTFGVDGFDFDLENYQGTDPVASMAPIRAVITGLKSAGRVLITVAPQMTDVSPGWPSISPGFNRYVPLLAQPFGSRDIDLVMPQMYNTWQAVETIAYAESYAAQLLAGFVVTSGSSSYNITVAGSALLLGFPATPSGAGSGYLSPPAVVAAVRALANNGTAIAGLMTWDIGWDQQGGWPFATAVASG